MNTLPKSTAAILAYKSLNRDVDKAWIDWAVEMLMNGFDSEHLVILAGISPPYDQFELQSLTQKVFQELKLDYSDQKIVIRNYVSYLFTSEVTENSDIQSILKGLRSLRDIYYELDYDNHIRPFYFLYYGVEDLQHDEVQWYIDGLDRSNIREIVNGTFTKWLAEN